MRPGRSRQVCGVPLCWTLPLPLPLTLPLTLTLTLPLTLPLTRQALLDEGGLDGDAQEYFTCRS